MGRGKRIFSLKLPYSVKIDEFELYDTQEKPNRRSAWPAHYCPWRDRDARFHAGRDAGNSQSDAAQGFERNGVPDFARQYLSPLPTPGCGADSRIGRAAPLHGLGWTDFDGQ